MSDIVIYGRGKTGQGLYKLLQRQGKTAVFYDDSVGFDGEGDFTDKSMVLLSPGVKPDSEGIKRAKNAGATLVTELEFCLKYLPPLCVSVTGTNGKTTVCEMIRFVLNTAGVRNRLLGNGGVPLSSEAADISSDETVILESSSFQLANATTFAPYISVFTSLACDHIDYHGSYDEYVKAKVNNFVRQRQGYAVFNADDENVVEVSKLCSCKRLYYSAYDSDADCYFDGNGVVVKLDGKRTVTVCPRLTACARHNLSNALAAVSVASLLGVEPDVAVSAVANYRLLPHRLQTVATFNGVTFVDDSKATNVHATVSALTNYAQPLSLILGGSDKGEAYDGIFSCLGGNVVAVAASGDTARAIADCGKKYGVNVEVFDDIRQAVAYCYDAVKGGGVVLMSNACASFDRFRGYAERGEYFQQVVKELSGGKTTN